tara:strand:+ start:2286 stop:2432 length:147 start_codon:yes stop_codon:yes gene_type:complete
MEDISNNNINLEIVEKEVEEKPKDYDVVRYTDKRGYCYRIKYVAKKKK